MNRKEAMDILSKVFEPGSILVTAKLLHAFEQLGMIKLEEDVEHILCREDEDWNWWLKQPAEFKVKVVQLVRFLEKL